MPFYEYRCASCGHQDSFLESISAPQQKTCPQCRKRRAFKRLVSAAGFQLKGDGWYVTDFKNKDKPPAAKSGGKADGSADKADAGADKPAAKGEGGEKSKDAAGKSDGKKAESKKPAARS